MAFRRIKTRDTVSASETASMGTLGAFSPGGEDRPRHRRRQRSGRGPRRRLAEAGAAVACHGNRRPAEETAQRIREAGGAAHSLSADLSLPDGPERLFADTEAAMGAPDILVNNAGTIHARSRRKTTIWRHQPRHPGQPHKRLSVLAQLAGRGDASSARQGKIINIASMMSFSGRHSHCGVRGIQRRHRPGHQSAGQ